MYPDREYRFVLAIMDPTPELSEAGWYIAIQHAINDAESAGIDAAEDAGIRLLKMKSEIAKGNRTDIDETKGLTQICAKRLSAIRREPILALLAAHDIGADGKLKKWFHAEARKALVAIADCGGINSSDYQLVHRLGHLFEPGSTYMIGKGFHIEVTAGRKFSANVGLYRTKNRDFITGDSPRWRTLLHLLDARTYGEWLKQQISIMQMPDGHAPTGEKLDRESALTQSEEGKGQ